MTCLELSSFHPGRVASSLAYHSYASLLAPSLNKMLFALIFITFCLMSFPVVAQEEGGDVRNFIWGVGKEDVKKFERVILFEEVENALFFVDEWAEEKVLIGYEFWDDKLIRTSIDVQKSNYPDPGDAVAFYVAREYELNEKLGVEGKQETIWKNDYYAKMPNHFALAVLNGHVDLITRWDLPRTRVIMAMTAEDFAYTHRVTYESKELSLQRTQVQNEAGGPLLAPPEEEGAGSYE